ncbi:MAG: hypothetical protein IIX23_04845 [Oscillospiraceae bacterium]|nr:hypothetical protein [Oscillospiraceae bacterium]
MKNSKTAWYLDDDVLLEGTVIKNRFYADRNICGFDIQEFDEDMIEKEIFFDLEKAISVCGEVPIIKTSPNRTRSNGS